ncbi:geranylgeranyl transferase type-2 subunit alpha [Phtheirospermum japonicum]|uniref:Geranylgeranyl transferase type-2 subunit alpha n=1 Tax=Phtheirospermum japonicum TaxID=374723 RepID=A0A830BLE4_9LAMI|nr:geranylgeranyl transferase type-2 subunit alpha [Phtheirospermum japonicum]
MHGRPRKALTEEEQGASSLKATKVRELQSQVLHFHHNKMSHTPKKRLKSAGKLLESNPEHYTGWNYRKLAVHTASISDRTMELIASRIQLIFDEELRLVENALKKNFKSYGAWHHRKWVLEQRTFIHGQGIKASRQIPETGCPQFSRVELQKFITTLKKIPDEEELQYTTDMIYDNFSNYSAWHNRSILLSNILEKRGKTYDDKGKVLAEEYDFVRNALFTDPDDQSGWFYHLWLLDQTLKRDPIFISSWPPNASKLYLSPGGYCLNGHQSYPTLEFHSQARTFPLVLYFSDPVEGISSSTVTIEYYQASDDLIWRPLSVNNSEFSQAWLTFLKFPNETRSLEPLPVKVTIAHAPGVICRISFSIYVASDERKRSEADRISWKEENYKALATESEEVNLTQSFSKLEINIENKATTDKWCVETISNEIDHCRELLSTTNCKIGKLTLARLLTARNTLTSYICSEDGNEADYEDILELYQDLMKMDPAHVCYYEDEHSLVLLKQLTSNKVSLSKHCSQYQESLSPSENHYLSVRLNGLSVSRIGSMEHLLWVQMLDLSHNKLHSIEGLETLQLLSCLNLSHNKICSFTALEPLKMIKCLKALDISHNEIGAHSIDTRRYLCSSPLTQALGSDEWHFQKFANEDVKLKDHWDAYLLFKDLSLMQLEIMGNAIVDDRLKALLLKLMPELKWIDGEKCH